MNSDDCIKRLFKLLRDFRLFPKYAMERRVDIFIALFLEEFLQSRPNNKDCKIQIVAPELPPLNVDYLLHKSGPKPAWILFELKTDEKSIDCEQLKKYLEAKTRKGGMNAMVGDIEELCKGKYKHKYEHLLKKMREVGSFDDPLHIIYLSPISSEKQIACADISEKDIASVEWISLKTFAEWSPAQCNVIWDELKDLLNGIEPSRAVAPNEISGAQRRSCPLGDHAFGRAMSINGARARLRTHLQGARPKGHGLTPAKARTMAGTSWLPIGFTTGHIIMIWEGRSILLDTGAPFSIGADAAWTFLGRPVSLRRDYNGLTIEQFRKAAREPRLDVILGMDVLNRYNFVIDKAEKSISFFTCETHLPSCIEMHREKCIPVINVAVGSVQTPMFIDTGAKVSYGARQIVQKHHASGNAEDFYPGYGQFQTDLYSIPSVIGDERVNLNYGILPEHLGALLSAPVQGLIGAEIFNTHKVWFLMLQNQLGLRRYS